LGGKTYITPLDLLLLENAEELLRPFSEADRLAVVETVLDNLV
jgi:hypothetical protein